MMVEVNSYNLLNIETYRTPKEHVRKFIDDKALDSTFFHEFDVRYGKFAEFFGKEKIMDIQPFGPQALSLDFTFPGDPEFFGLPERSLDLSLHNTLYIEDGRLLINEEPMRLYNTDYHQYKFGDSFGLYGSIPLIHSVGSQNVKNKTK